ncbi:Pkinase-domain-containing protein [Auriscalpium vulgare]|uniref:Pkinase-domain-containing protein n=1 Tax=Auriscalpium vulgare TaxID=40419 RepID=A0ACB8SDW2_9AGAM|nr:Pkinase-domain-containing protein [Auriscalpium vulgare]
MKYAEFLKTWTDTHISGWLTEVKCSHQASTFKANDIRGDVLLELDQETLKEMGITSIGDRLRILNAVKQLRQKCSTKTDRNSFLGAGRPRVTINVEDLGHKRMGSNPSPNSRRRQDHGRPPPLQLNSSAGSQSNLPHLIRDGTAGPDSASTSRSNIRPLPQPVSSVQNSSSTPHSSTPGSSHSAGPRIPLPPVPRGQPPPPPPAPAGRTRNLLGSGPTGRKTPTLDAPEYTSQPLPPAPAPGLLTPQLAQNWSGYGLPSDPRPGMSGVKTPVRSQSPLPSVPPRGAARSPNPSAVHGRNLSAPNTNATSVPGPSQWVAPRPAPTPGNHPYSQSLQPQINTALSPIAESFMGAHTPTQPMPSGSPSPPTSFAVGRGPFGRPTTPSVNTTPSLVDLRRKLVKFQLAGEGHSATINVEDCHGGIEVLEKALKKFGKLNNRGSDFDALDRVGIEDGGLSVDGWAVFLDWGHQASPGAPLTEAQLLSICHAPPDDPAREHGLTLRRGFIGKNRRAKALAQVFGEQPPSGQYSTPDSPQFAVPRLPMDDDDEDAAQLSPTLRGSVASSQGATLKSMKRASTISVLSGLGVADPEKALDSPSSPTQATAEEKRSSGQSKIPAKLRNFFGQRPPSELITNHLAEYFPFTEKKVLERTARHSMLRAGGISFGKRDSTISFNPRSSSRFSVSTLASHKASHRASTVSSLAPPVLEHAPEEPDPLEPAPRVSLSVEGGSAIELDPEDEDVTPQKQSSHAHLLPEVNFSFESFSETMHGLTGGKLGTRPLSSASSKRMSYITELRSKRDVSDTASFMTVDEITAEVESRRNSGPSGDSASTEEWTTVTADEEEEEEAEPEEPEAPMDVPIETSEADEDIESDEEYDDEEDEDDEDEDGTGRAISSGGIKWIKGALIGAGSFGKVYLGMDAENGLLMAVKQVEVPSGASDERRNTMVDALEREIELLKDLEHEHIVQYLYSSSDDEFFNIFLEYVPGGSVTALLRNYGAFEEQLVRNFVRQILDGLNYVHERGIVHRDIKGANILVDNKGGVKISDFGISKKLEDNLMPGNRLHRPSLQGSVFWMAPEVVKQTAYTKKADIWSVGCLVVEMLTGEHPWAQLNQMQAIFKIGSFSAKPPIPSDVSANAQDFLELCFELDHELRPSAGDLLGHPWLNKKTGKKGAGKNNS